MNSNKKIAVVGAGVSGLVSIKACKEENLQVVCYEISNDIGGLWKYREENIPNVPSVSKMTVMNSSKEMSAFSDFPPPRNFPVFMPHFLNHEYITSYAEKFSLIPHIRFGRRVTMVEEADDFQTSGKWKVTALRLDSMKTEEDVYDAVMVCTGNNNNPSIPSLPGQSYFKGNIIHSGHYKDASNFKNRRVLVVGVSNSASDVAVDLCGVAETVYMSSRNGMWLYPRKGPNGKPYDAFFITRIKLLLLQYLPRFISNAIVENELKKYFDTSPFNLTPTQRVFNSIPTINDLISFYLLNGMIKIKNCIKQFTSDGIIFEGEEKVTPVDDVIFATGYKIDFPFLQRNFHPSDLYKCIISPVHEHFTLAFIGFVEIAKGLTSIFEMQALWFVQMLQGKIKLPDKQKMREKIANCEKDRISRYGKDRHKTVVMETYMDDLANDIGVKPNLLSMLFRDPWLFYSCLTGPVLPYQYRLQGCHSWSGAREAILSYEKRLYNV